LAEVANVVLVRMRHEKGTESGSSYDCEIINEMHSKADTLTKGVIGSGPGLTDFVERRQLILVPPRLHRLEILRA